jgi:flagellar hook protein FlgE
MKHLFYRFLKCLSFSAVLVCITPAYAQDCKSYYFLHNNAEVQVTLYDDKGNKSAMQTWVVNDVNTDDSGARSTVTSTMVNSKGQELAKSTGTYRCREGRLMADIRMVLPYNQDPQGQQAQPTATGKLDEAYVEYPAVMTEGMQLPDAIFELEVTTAGGPSVARIEMTNRKVEGKEKVTSDAGSWDAYKITYDAEMKMRIAGIGVPMTMKTTEWFVPGFGVVKSESYNKKGKLRGKTLLTGLKM